MVYTIRTYDGNILATVPEGVIDATSASIQLPGRGFSTYGQPVLNDLIWMTGNFAGTTSPHQPIVGQLWYSTATNFLNVWDGSTWNIVTSVVVDSATAPASPTIGALWFDTANLQLKAWNGTVWAIVGPLGSDTGSDPVNPAMSTTASQFTALLITDNHGVNHNCWRLSISGTPIIIISKDTVFTPGTAITGFTSIYPGININGTSGYTLTGTVSNSLNLGGIPAANYLRNNADGVPNVDLAYDLGNPSNHWRNLYVGNIVSPYTLPSVTSITGTGDQVIVSGTTSVTLSLPQSIGLGDGVEFGSIGIGHTAGTTGQLVFSDGTVQTTAGAPAGAANEFSSIGIGHAAGTTGQLVFSDGTVQTTAATSDSYSGSLTGNGYQILPTGLILQWGNGSVGQNSTITQALSISFPNTFFQVIVSLTSSGGTNNSLVGYITGSLNSFRVGYASTAGGANFSYYAIGN